MPCKFSSPVSAGRGEDACDGVSSRRLRKLASAARILPASKRARGGDGFRASSPRLRAWSYRPTRCSRHSAWSVPSSLRLVAARRLVAEVHFLQLEQLGVRDHFDLGLGTEVVEPLLH